MFYYLQIYNIITGVFIRGVLLDLKCLGFNEDYLNDIRFVNLEDRKQEIDPQYRKFYGGIFLQLTV